MNWSPEQPNGWYPFISFDGRYVVYGVNGVFITNLMTKETHSYPNGYFGRWLNENTVIFGVYVAKDAMQLYTVAIGDWNAQPLNIDPAVSNAHDFAAGENHWAATVSATRIVIDGIVAERALVWGAKIAGDYLITTRAAEGYIQRFRLSDGEVNTINLRVPAKEYAVHSSGIVAYGYPEIFVSNENTVVDVTASPLRKEWAPCLFSVNGELWVATATTLPGANYVLLRPVKYPATEECIIVEGLEAAHIHCMQISNKIRIAVSSAIGACVVYDVDINDIRQRLLPRVQSNRT